MANNVTNTLGGTENYPEKLLVKNQKRGYPLAEGPNDQDGFNDFELTTYGYDPHKDVVIYPDGTTEEVAFGKNPHWHQHHGSGHSINIFKDGTVAILRPANHYEYVKGGQTHTNDGHHDHRGGGHMRHNYDGGQYQDHKDDLAIHVGKNHATHVVGNSTDNTQGHKSIRSNKGLSIGTQDDGGQLAMSINMHDGKLEILSKGDVTVTSKTGAIKFQASNIALQADNNLTLKSSTYNLATQVKQEGYNSAKLPTAPTTSYTYGQAVGYHSDAYNVNTQVAYTNTLNTDGSGSTQQGTVPVEVL